jgi:hypothetical protein
MRKGLLVFGRRCTRWTIAAVFAVATAFPAATGGAAMNRTAAVPADLLGVWHKTMTAAEWKRAGVYRDVGVWTFVIRKSGTVTVYKPGGYRASCGSACSDFTTTFRPSGGRLTLGSVPVCSFKGIYSWRLIGSTLVVRPVEDRKCVVRATFFGGRWKR